MVSNPPSWFNNCKMFVSPDFKLREEACTKKTKVILTLWQFFTNQPNQCIHFICTMVNQHGNLAPTAASLSCCCIAFLNLVSDKGKWIWQSQWCCTTLKRRGCFCELLLQLMLIKDASETNCPQAVQEEVKHTNGGLWREFGWSLQQVSPPSHNFQSSRRMAPPNLLAWAAGDDKSSIKPGSDWEETMIIVH